ncbi:hypothetical protein CAOG_008300 [Capsaspora owczarzaki ATCC 30864]|uniref:Major capsid protein n=2 Tax=Capsaspora owczarzaki (strain ATCC 30864) TaxID=595528 RepID=A0A0D2WYX4_CAPO3|nr:hypothetical protein CAOG_008300 [Capsaspora owczarzaki ATCC 30864]
MNTSGNPNIEFKPFNRYEYVELPDNNNGNYSSGIKFNVNSLQSGWSDPANGYVMIDYLLKKANGLAISQAEYDSFSLNCGTYSLLGGVNITMGTQNKVILDDDKHLPLTNHLHWMAEWSKDYAETKGRQYAYALDANDVQTNAAYGYEFPAVDLAGTVDNKTVNNTGAAGAKIGELVSDAVTVPVATTPLQIVGNQAFAIRKAVLETYSLTPFVAGVSTSLQYRIPFPMKFFTDAFRAMDFAIWNLRMDINMDRKTDAYPTLATTTAGVAHNFSFTPINGTAKLYIPMVEWHTEHQPLFNTLSLNYSKDLEYFQYVVKEDVIANNLIASVTDKVLFEKETDLRQLYILAMADPVGNDGIIPSDKLYPYIYNRRVTDVTVKLNTKPLYASPITSDVILYDYYTQSLASSGLDTSTSAQIGWIDYRRNYFQTLFDFTSTEAVNASNLLECKIMASFKPVHTNNVGNTPNVATRYLYVAKCLRHAKITSDNGVMNVA